LCDKAAIHQNHAINQNRGRSGMAGRGEQNGNVGKGRGWIRILLLLPFLGVLWVPFYNSVEPTFFSVPFFYWYQMLWIIICAVVVWIVYRADG